MARPKKTGLDYFPFDVDLFDDPKVLPVSVEFGAQGEAIVVRLLCAIYREGYYAQWTDGLKFKIANQAKVSEEIVSNVVLKLVKYHFFSNEMFNDEQILTSRGIQNRWKEATRKRVTPKELPYWFPAEETKVSGGRNTPKSKKTPLNRSESTQKKRKEKKVNNTPPNPQGEVDTSDISWKKDFDVYLRELRREYRRLVDDEKWVAQQEVFNPGVDIPKSIEKSCVNFWATEAGWKRKKRARSKTIDWKSTFANAVSQPMNRVYKPRVEAAPVSKNQKRKPDKW